MDENLLDDIIQRLLATPTGRTAKQINLPEAEIRQLCSASKEVFLSQPNLLELEAPIKICGKFTERSCSLFFLSSMFFSACKFCCWGKLRFLRFRLTLKII